MNKGTNSIYANKMQDRKDQNFNCAPVFFKQMGEINLQALKNSISLLGPGK